MFALILFWSFQATVSPKGFHFRALVCGQCSTVPACPWVRVSPALVQALCQCRRSHAEGYGSPSQRASQAAVGVTHMALHESARHGPHAALFMHLHQKWPTGGSPVTKQPPLWASHTAVPCIHTLCAAHTASAMHVLTTWLTRSLLRGSAHRTTWFTCGRFHASAHDVAHTSFPWQATRVAWPTQRLSCACTHPVAPAQFYTVAPMQRALQPSYLAVCPARGRTLPK